MVQNESSWYQYLYIYMYIYYRPNSIYPAPWWSWCVTACRFKDSLRFCFQPPLTVPWTLGSRAFVVRPPHGARAAGAAPHRRCRRGPPEKCLRRLGQGSNAAAAHVDKVADRSPSGQTVDSCGAEIVERFLFSELPYNLPHKQKHTNLQTSRHQPSCLPSNRLLRPQHPLASFSSSAEINRKSSPRPLFISSTVLKAWHPIDSQGAATVRLLRVLLTSKASAKACSWVAGTADTKKTYCAVWLCFLRVFPTDRNLKSKTMQKYAKHNIPEIQKPLKSQTPRKERSFLNKANCWNGNQLWNFDRIQSTSLFYLHIVRSQRCFINWDHRIWSYETCAEGLKNIRDHIMPGPPKTIRKTHFSDGFFMGFHG